MDSETSLAIKLSKVVHDKCKEVPHDIGLKLAEIVASHYKEDLDKNRRLRTEVVWAVTHYKIVDTDGIFDQLREVYQNLFEGGK